MRYQPIRYRQIKDVLEWASAFHASLAREYEALAQGPVQERVRMVLTYLAGHERVLKHAIDHFGRDAKAEILNTWHDHFPELDLPDTLESLRTRLETVETDEVVALALQFHDVLICMYRELSNTASTDEVREVFRDLLESELHEKKRLVRDHEQLEDY
jgi:hypothetical protein